MKKVIKSIGINEARKDMILANSVRDKTGNILFPKGNRLDYPAISLLRKEGINLIYIYQFVTHKNEDSDFETAEKPKPTKIPAPLNPRLAEPVPEIEPGLAANINDQEEEKFAVPASPKEKPPLKDVISIEIRKQGEQLVRDLFANPDKVQYSKVIELVSTVVEDILSTDETVISVQDLRNYDNYTYQHSVNLCVLGVTVGKLLSYTPIQLKEFGIGLLFHDFGKTKVPLEILNKPGRLTPEEFEIMKGHAEFGYQILGKKYKLPDITKLVIRHHHEKLDGTGYPMGLKGDELPEWVQISTIVDIYDALTSDRIYKSKWTHQNALEFLFERADKWFNIEYIRVLKRTIPEKKERFTLLDF
jgi:HD-GYP domain-containing protein (c-di-GMP phosphodiesterase class II)